MKKVLISIVIILGILVIYFSFKENKRVENYISTKKLNYKKINFSIKTTLFAKNRNVKEHLTNTKDVIFFNKNIIVTRGGIIKNDFINKYYNATEFNRVTGFNNKVVIGYRDGFLLLKGNYINHFIFNEPIKKCVFQGNDLFCIKNKTIIKTKEDSFIQYYHSKEKIVDLLYTNNNLYILTNKKLIIKDKYNEIKLNIANANKIITVKDSIFIISDREIFKLGINSIENFKKISSIFTLFSKNGKFYYISISGVIYNHELKKINSINLLINDIVTIDNIIYILTPNGIYIWKNNIQKFNFKFSYNTIMENYITNISKYKNNILISYFNSGIQILDKSMNIKTFIKNLNGVNDIFIQNNNVFIATTNGLYKYNTEYKSLVQYTKKDGLLGSNISSIVWYDLAIFIGSEGGISKKLGNKFNSINGLHGLINNRVNCLEVINNSLYVGTLGGVSILDGLKVIKSLNNKVFKSRWITNIKNIKNNVYIATYGGGIYKGNKGKFLPIIKLKKRIFFNLNTLFNYKNRFLLAGTLKNGIFIYNIKKNKYIFIKNLPSLNITAINIIDNKVFIGSDFGFWNINIKNIIEQVI